MTHRTIGSMKLLACLCIGLLNTGFITTSYAEEDSAQAAPITEARLISGKVTEVIETAGYTYAEVDTGSEKVWAAGPSTPLKTGHMVSFTSEMPMKNFHSEAMNRDFPVLYFVDGFSADKESSSGEAENIASPHKHINQQQISEPLTDIEKVADGNTIGEIHTDKQSLNGKTLRIRGQVTKYTAGVMGKNWIHIRDSSTLDDLTVTTTGTAAVNDVIIVEGKLGLDRDFGYGYVYPVILEEAKIVNE